MSYAMVIFPSLSFLYCCVSSGESKTKRHPFLPFSNHVYILRSCPTHFILCFPPNTKRHQLLPFSNHVLFRRFSVDVNVLRPTRFVLWFLWQIRNGIPFFQPCFDSQVLDDVEPPRRPARYHEDGEEGDARMAYLQPSLKAEPLARPELERDHPANVDFDRYRGRVWWLDDDWLAYSSVRMQPKNGERGEDKWHGCLQLFLTVLLNVILDSKFGLGAKIFDDTYAVQGGWLLIQGIMMQSCLISRGDRVCAMMAWADGLIR